MKQCLNMDIKLSNRIGQLSVPKGVELYVEMGLECFQNDEGSVEANDVDMIEEDLCVEANDVDMIEENLCVEANDVDMIEENLCVEANDVGMIEEDLCVEANDVGMIEENLCDTIWSVTKNCIDPRVDHRLTGVVRGVSRSRATAGRFCSQYSPALIDTQQEN